MTRMGREVMEISDKKHQKFSPTRGMKLYAYMRAKMGDKATDLEIATKMGCHNTTLSIYKSKEGFNEWFDEQVTIHRQPIHEMLEQIALDQLEDFNFWRVVAEKYGYLQAKDEQKVSRLIIQMDDEDQEISDSV